MLVGVIADTHGYVDPNLAQVFRDVELIVHAGDIGSPAVLDALGAIAPVRAVRGNVDRSLPLQALPERIDLRLHGIGLHLVHQLPQAIPLPQRKILVFGHSHRSLNEWRGSILYLNPGAAGRQGFHTIRTVALLRLEGQPESELVVLGPKARSKISGVADDNELS
ncbi:MAG: metallophosphoesterase family protein [Dehalococcoidia bacterium]